MTPMQEQYEKIKNQFPDTIVLFRLGDFYETFGEDAETLSKVLGITLTGRGKDENRIPMAGIPYHALPNYMPKMVQAGLKVAIADQMEEATPGKLVERRITKIITPGTIIDENSLDSSKNNYIASIFKIRNSNLRQAQSENLAYLGIVLSDLTTGELKVFSTSDELIFKNEINKYNPAEILCPDSQFDYFKSLLNVRLSRRSDLEFKYVDSYNILIDQFSVKTLKGFGITSPPAPLLKEKGAIRLVDEVIVSATGALIQYLRECQRGELKHIKSMRLYSYSKVMQLDPETIRNLELLYPMNGNDFSSTLYNVLNNCKSSMGKRKLRQWIITPIIDLEMLQERHDSVDMFYRERILTSEIQEILDRIVDIERVVGRIGVGSANPKDMVAFAVSLENILSLIEKLGVGQLPSRLRFLVENVRELENEIRNVSKLILNSLDDEPSAVLNQGGIIRTGYNSEVDELKSLRQNSKQILAEIQRREIERTKITSLKISFNNVFGYYIEVTRTHLDKVPTDYIRKQTLANAERFITEELKELETRILSAEEKLIKLEQELFIEIRNQVAEYSAQLLEIGDVVAEIDVLSNFGEIARENRYVKPVISSQLSVISRESEDSTLKTENLSLIAAGRHPVVETLVKEFTPNSTIFDDKGRIHIITGPNMSGKSTYIRQVALIQLMAQIGCFVPADEAEICIADRIFTRVGASDNLSKGESTFMVEMNETANILNNATKDSLIILDEVGRGTSTYDGVAIAWSIVEYISQKIGARTLFATHYHELTELSQSYKGVKNYTVNVIEENENVLFTHRIVEGSADKSYGVYVAKLAGVPIDVVKRANEILDRFEKREAGDGIENENERRDMGNGNEPGIEKRDLRNVTLEDKNRPESRNSHPVSPKVPKKIHPEQLGLI